MKKLLDVRLNGNPLQLTSAIVFANLSSWKLAHMKVQVNATYKVLKFLRCVRTRDQITTRNQTSKM